MTKNGMRPIHPGEILREEFLTPLGISANALSKALHVPASRMNDIVLERRGITADTALRLARYFGGEAESWLRLQQAYDLKMTAKTLAKVIEKEITPLTAEEFAHPDERLALA
jgi:antitoxin HigA-1